MCVHDNLKTIADICLLLGSYVDWRKVSDKFACRGHFWECSWSLGMSYSVTGSENPSPMSSFSSSVIIIITRLYAALPRAAFRACKAATWPRLCRDIVCRGHTPSVKV